MKRTAILVLIILLIPLIACQGISISGLFDRVQSDQDPEQTAQTSESAEQTEAASSPQIGDPAPDFTLPTLSGETISLQDLRGKVVLLNFWATWCGPCRFETPDLQRLYEQYQAQDLVVIGVSVDEDETVDRIPAFIEEFGLTYPIILDPDLDVSNAYEANYYNGGIPKSFYIDPEGIIKDIGDGALDWDFMEGKALTLIDPQAGAVRMAALDLVTEGQELAEDGDIEGATAKFEEALTVDSGLSLEDPEAEARHLAASSMVQQGENMAREGDVEDALAAYEEALSIDPTLEISAGLWNNLCWWGSLWGYAADVLEACEKGVELAAPNRQAGNSDSRGLARAITGDYEGAIADFKRFVAYTKENGQYERYGAKRDAWIIDLEAGQNPFDEATLEELRDE